MSIHLYSRYRDLVVLYGACFLVVVMGCGLAAPNDIRYRPGRFEFNWPPHATPSPGIRRSIHTRLAIDTELLIVKLQDVAVTSAVGRANSRRPATLVTVMKVEEAWRRASLGDPTVSSRTDAACSESLKLMSVHSADFEEIIVTDSRGLIVCQTRMSERYFQGDQAWWRECVEGGRLSHSRLAYDAASGVVALAIFAPVYDPSSGETIGVARALLRTDVRQ